MLKEMWLQLNDSQIETTLIDVGLLVFIMMMATTILLFLFLGNINAFPLMWLKLGSFEVHNHSTLLRLKCPIDKNEVLLVRQCYPGMYKHFHNVPHDGIYVKAKSLLIGTSGIGKSIFLFYFLRRLQDEGGWLGFFQLLPCAIYCESSESINRWEASYFVVWKCGMVWHCNSERSTFVSLAMWNKECWLLLDGKETQFSRNCGFCKVLHVCSPHISNYYRNFITTLFKLHYMRPWDNNHHHTTTTNNHGVPDELIALREYCYPEVTIDTLTALYHRWGAIPLHILSNVSLTGYHSNLHCELITAGEGTKVEDVCFCTKNPATSRFLIDQFVMYDVDEQNNYQAIGIRFASKYIADQWGRYWFHCDRKRMIDFLSWYRNEAAIASYWSQVFIQYAHGRLAEGGDFQVQRMYPTDHLDAPQWIHLPPAPLRFIGDSIFEEESVVDNNNSLQYLIPLTSASYPSIDSMILQYSTIMYFHMMTIDQQQEGGIIDRACIAKLKEELAINEGEGEVEVLPIYMVTPPHRYDSINWQTYSTAGHNSNNNYPILPAVDQNPAYVEQYKLLLPLPGMKGQQQQQQQQIVVADDEPPHAAGEHMNIQGHTSRQSRTRLSYNNRRHGRSRR